MEVKVFQIHKRSSYIFNDIQDKYSMDTQKGIYALSDGATQGFMSQSWAEKLVKTFTEYSTFEPRVLIDSFKTKATEFNQQDFQLDPNPAIKSLQMRKKQAGAFATFMGVEIAENSLRYISSGDVCAAVIRNGNTAFFPFHSLEELDKDKGFLGTNQIMNNEVEENQFRKGKISLQKNDQIILMTDAIARLTLKNPNLSLKISNFQDFESFKNWIIEQWDKKLLEEDDITLISIKIDTANSVKEFLATDVVFPKEEKIMISIPSANKNTSQKSMADLQEISRLERIIQQKDNEMVAQKNKIDSLQKKLKYLVIGIISMFAICIILLLSYWIYSQFSNKIKNIKLPYKNIIEIPIKQDDKRGKNKSSTTTGSLKKDAPNTVTPKVKESADKNKKTDEKKVEKAKNTAVSHTTTNENSSESKKNSDVDVKTEVQKEENNKETEDKK